MKSTIEKIREQRGITLVALVVTIIILLILAGIAMSMMIGENGIIKRAKAAKEINTIADMKEKLSLAIGEVQLDKVGNTNLDDINKELLDNKIKEYECSVKLAELSNRKIIIMKKGEIKGRFVIDDKLNIIEEKGVDAEINYEIISREGEKLNIVVCIKEQQYGIKKVLCPNGKEVTNSGNEAKIDYIVDAEFDKEYEFKIQLENEQEISEMLIINKIKYNYTGSPQIVNLKAGKYNIECYGARGGNGGNLGIIHSYGGLGGYTSGKINLEQEKQIYLYIGQIGQDTHNGGTLRASFNGGAIGGGDTYGGAENGGSGGGATDIRLNSELTSRIMVAGGGGGAGGWPDCPGKNGGLTTGLNNTLGIGTNGITAQSGGGGRRRRLLWRKHQWMSTNAVLCRIRSKWRLKLY